MVFTFVANFIGPVTVLVEQTPMTRMYSMYSDLVSSFMGYKCGEMTDDVRIGEMRGHIKEYKSLLKTTLDEICEIRLYTLKFLLLDHVVDDPEQFGGLKLLDALPFERFNRQIKRAYRIKSQR